MVARWMITCLLLTAVAASVKAEQPPSPKEPRYVSQSPLYLNVVFGEDAGKGMLVVLDETKGDGTGYNVAYVDESLDGDLTNDKPKTFEPQQRQGAKGMEAAFSFDGPCPYRKNDKITYRLDLYSLSGKNSKDGEIREAGARHYFFWWMTDKEKWDYFFINGVFRVYASSAEAMAGEPIRLGGKCKWSIEAKQKDKDVALSMGLKDANDCTLRSVSGAGGEKAPTFSVVDKAGKDIVKDKKMAFG